MIDEKIEKEIRKELKVDAKGVGIPVGAAEVFIDRALKDAKKRLEARKIITRDDLRRAIGIELTKYNKDLAYVYKNKERIF